MQGTERANKVADKRCLQAPVVLPLTKSPKEKKGSKQNCRPRSIPQLKTLFCVFFEN